MAKRPRVSLEAIEAAHNAGTSQRYDLKPATVEAAAALATKGRPHVSLYLSKAVQREIKRIALEADRKPHDLYVEAIDMLLRHHGRPSVAELRDARRLLRRAWIMYISALTSTRPKG